MFQQVMENGLEVQPLNHRKVHSNVLLQARVAKANQDDCIYRHTSQKQFFWFYVGT